MIPARPDWLHKECNRITCQAHRARTTMRTILLLVTLTAGLVSCTQKPATPSQADAVPPKFTPEEVAQSLTLLVREGEKGKARFAALDAVRDSAPYVTEFVRLFPAAEVNYRYFTSPEEPGFDVGVDLHERYEFRVQLPVRFDSERLKVIGYGEPKFVIWEAASVTRGPSGTAVTTLNPAGERHFGSAEWRTLVERGGDFAAIRYTMVTNGPVPGFAHRRVQP